MWCPLNLGKSSSFRMNFRIPRLLYVFLYMGDRF